VKKCSKKYSKKDRLIFIRNKLSENMQQLKLLNPYFVIVKIIDFENIKATFTKTTEDIFEVLLEINSNKFIINFQTTMNRIENLEIIAVK